MPVRTLDAEIPADAGLRVAVVVSRYNDWITSRLRDGAVEELERRHPGGHADVIHVPGSFELPVAVGRAIATGRYRAAVAIGCLIRGETMHDRHIATAVTTALSEIAATTGIPVAFGLLTTDSADQAEARAGGPMGNKGAEAMTAALDTIAALAAIDGAD